MLKDHIQINVRRGLDKLEELERLYNAELKLKRYSIVMTITEIVRMSAQEILV